MTEFVKIAKFENLLDLEFNVRSAQASAMFQGTGVPLHRQNQIAVSLRKALGEAVDALSVEELDAFGDYRRASREEIASRFG